MIQQIWDKRVVAQIQLSPQDVADQLPPLPLFLALSWNHYLAFYYQQIFAFFSSYIIYPYKKQQFHLLLQSQSLTLDGTEIVGNLITHHALSLKTPLKFICKLRSRSPLPQIQIKRHFKYSLKASTTIRNSKQGASLLTLHMSIDNVQKVYQSFVNNNLQQYLGSDDNQGNQKLGYSFLTSKTEKIPVRIVGNDFLIERGEKKENSLGKLLAYIFQEAGTQNNKNTNTQVQNTHQQKYPDQVTEEEGIQPPNGSQEIPKRSEPKSKYQTDQEYNYIFKKYDFYMHGVKITRGEYPLTFFQRYCHPDGFLYIFFREH